MKKVMVCQLPALMNNRKPGEAHARRPRLTVVGKSVAAPTPPAQTFHEAALAIVEFGRRWQEGSASQSEAEDADVLLLGLRRLLADSLTEIRS